MARRKSVTLVDRPASNANPSESLSADSVFPACLLKSLEDESREQRSSFISPNSSTIPVVLGLDAQFSAR
jgi:hypothetical protein